MPTCHAAVGSIVEAEAHLPPSLFLKDLLVHGMLLHYEPLNDDVSGHEHCRGAIMGKSLICTFFAAGAAMPGAGLNLQQRIAQYHQDQQRAQGPLGSPHAAQQQPGQHAQRPQHAQQAPITPQQSLPGRSGSMPPASSPQNHLVTFQD